MSVGHKNPKMTAKPRTKPLAGRSWEPGLPGVGVLSLDEAGVHPTAQLSARRTVSPRVGVGQDRFCNSSVLMMP